MSLNEIISSMAGLKLLGEVVAWSTTGVVVTQTQLQAALAAAGLDAKLSLDAHYRNAFARACRELSENRIIRRLSENSAQAVFQFTAEHLAGDRLEYAFEAKLTLDKQTGTIACDVPELAARAKELLDRCMEQRTANDVTRLIQRIFRQQADLFPIREAGGAYFVPAAFAGIVNQVELLLTAIGGHINRLPVPAGTAAGDRSVRDVVYRGLSAAIEEHMEAIAEFGQDTRPDTLDRAAERIQQTRFKVETYAEYLGEQRAKLEEALAEAGQRLTARVNELTTAASEAAA